MADELNGAGGDEGLSATALAFVANLAAQRAAAREAASTPSTASAATSEPAGGDVAVADGDRPAFVISSPNAPMPVANDLLMRWSYVRYADGRPVRRTIHWRGEWWDHIGTHYQVSTERSMENSLWRVLDDASYWHGGDDDEEAQERRWEPNRTRVGNVMKALEARTEVADTVVPGSWLVFPHETWLTPYADPERSAGPRLVATMNVLLDPKTGETMEHSPAYLNTFCLPFEHDAEATCPEWTAYLASILDEESINLLQEWFGYVISGRTDLQKMLYMMGPSRSGKGTIALILSSLIGLMNVAGPTMNSFSGPFGLQSLVDKPLAIFDDVRLPPRPDNVYAAVEKLLSLIGEARMTVERKNRDALNVVLPTRIMMSANELLQFPDEVGAMQTRMLVLVFTKSFVGREKRDEEFKDLFLAELPGILNWALIGLARLNENGGRFTPPASSAEVSEELRDAGNPVRAFVRDSCTVSTEEEILATASVGMPAARWIWADELYATYADQHGGFKDDRAQQTRFGRELKAAFPQVVRARRRRDGVMAYLYEHVELNEEHKARAVALREEAEAMREAKRWAQGL